MNRLNVTIDLNDIWPSDESLAVEIQQQIKYAVQTAVKKEVNAAVKDVLADQHKEIKAAAKQYGALVLKDLLKETK